MMIHRCRYRLLTLTTLALTFFLTGCASFYVDTALKDIPPQDITKPATPTDAQLVFEFRTKGVGNARATTFLKEQVTALVLESGLFANVTDTPSQNGGFLSVIIDNVPLSDDAFSKGFVTGMTFGLAGNTVTDGYVCAIEYIPAGQKDSVKTTVRHAIHTTIGAKGAPENATPAANVDEAVRTMTRQIVMNGLKALSQESAFTSQE